jgi:hypothetical protein
MQVSIFKILTYICLCYKTTVCLQHVLSPWINFFNISPSFNSPINSNNYYLINTNIGCSQSNFPTLQIVVQLYITFTKYSLFYPNVYNYFFSSANNHYFTSPGIISNNNSDKLDRAINIQTQLLSTYYFSSTVFCYSTLTELSLSNCILAAF